MPVVDASVWVAFFHKNDVFHKRSRSFLTECAEAESAIHIPTLCFAEVAGSIRRVTGSAVVANKAVALIRRLVSNVWVLDRNLGRAAAALAAGLALRGADAVYVAVARETGETLVTLDEQQRLRAATEIVTLEP